MTTFRAVATAALLGLFAGVASAADQAAAPFALQWRTVANNGDTVPADSAARPFNSYNPPSVSRDGFVVFRGRSRGPEPPASGVFARDMSKKGGTLYPIATRGMNVPAPNNTGATFNEFPSFARSAIRGRVIATRGNSEPVWRYTTDDGETRVGTSGVFAAVDGVSLNTALAQLGLVPGFEQFLVPGVATPARFDQFPGAPSPTDEGMVLTKGNYSVGGVRQTGIFYRDLSSGDAAVQLIANSASVIPNLPAGVSGITFGSTAPPSAAKGRVVFVGYDNEDDPTYGGIYLATISPSPTLKTLMSIGDSVPGISGATFSRFGEGVSFDGANVAFWGTWGTQTQTLRLHCPTEGNRDRVEYCRDEDPATDRSTAERWQDKPIPVNQGIFVHNVSSGKTKLLARTRDDNAGIDGFDDFLYWTYSGHPPGTGGGEGDAEPPRWRSAAFLAVSNQGGGANSAAAFKARTGDIDPDSRTYETFIDGIYLRRGPNGFPLATVIDTTMGAAVIDPEAPAGARISSVGIERDGFRDSQLVITASMLGDDLVALHAPGDEDGEEESTWAGVYIVKIPDTFARAIMPRR